KSRWVKAFNTVYYKTLATEAHRDGDPIGIPLAGEDRAALEIAARLVRDAGFDPVIVGALARGKEFEPGTRAYNSGMSGRELRGVFSNADSHDRPTPPEATASYLADPSAGSSKGWSRIGRRWQIAGSRKAGASMRSTSVLVGLGTVLFL